MNIKHSNQPLITNQAIVLITIFGIFIIAAAAVNSGIVNIQDPVGLSRTRTATWIVPVIATETITPTFLASTGWWNQFPTPVPAFYTSTPTITCTPTKTKYPTITPKKK